MGNGASQGRKTGKTVRRGRENVKSAPAGRKCSGVGIPLFADGSGGYGDAFRYVGYGVQSMPLFRCVLHQYSPACAAHTVIERGGMLAVNVHTGMQHEGHAAVCPQQIKISEAMADFYKKLNG